MGVGAPRFVSLAVTVGLHVLVLMLVIHNRFSPASDRFPSQVEHIVTVYDVPEMAAKPEHRQAIAAPAPGRTESTRPERHPEARHVDIAAPAMSAMTTAPDIEGQANEIASPQHEPSDVAQDYRQALFARLARHRNYPEAARLRNYQGDGAVSFRIDRGGNLLDASMERSTGLAVLDRAALRQVRRSAPFPQIPAELPDELVVAMPLQFLIVPPARQIAAR